MINYQRGYSLLELTLVLAIMGVLAATMASLTPHLMAWFQQNTQNEALLRADQALVGFTLTHSRLPCPDINNDGLEDCSVNAVGDLPYKTMEMSSLWHDRRGLALRYAVYRNANVQASQDADMAVLKDRYTPLLPSTSAINLNGLDVCMALRTAARAAVNSNTAYVGIGTSIQNVAYAIASSGSNAVFDGLNGAVGMGFEQPDKALTSSYDDSVRAIGFNVLASRLDCPATMAQVNGFARAAFAAADMARLANLYKQFRDFSVGVNDTGVVLAGVSVALATSDIALSIASLALGVAGAFESFGAAAAVGVAGGIAALATSTAGLVLAGIGLSDAIAGQGTAHNQQTAANTALSNANNVAAQQMILLNNADAKGLLR